MSDIISLIKHITHKKKKKYKDYLHQKGETCRESQRVLYQKLQLTVYHTQKAVDEYVTHHWNRNEVLLNV